MKKFYKTFLASLLAAAMVVTSVPAEILAAPAEIVEEEVTVAEPSDAVVSDATVVEEEVGEVDPIEPDNTAQDVALQFAAYNKGTQFLTVSNFYGADYTELGDGDGDADNRFLWDHENDYYFYLTPDTGHELPTTGDASVAKTVKVTYVDKTGLANTAQGTTKTAEAGTDFIVGEPDENGHILITVKAAFLGKALAARDNNAVAAGSAAVIGIDVDTVATLTFFQFVQSSNIAVTGNGGLLTIGTDALKASYGKNYGLDIKANLNATSQKKDATPVKSVKLSYVDDKGKTKTLDPGTHMSTVNADTWNGADADELTYLENTANFTVQPHTGNIKFWIREDLVYAFINGIYTNPVITITFGDTESTDLSVVVPESVTDVANYHAGLAAASATKAAAENALVISFKGKDNRVIEKAFYTIDDEAITNELAVIQQPNTGVGVVTATDNTWSGDAADASKIPHYWYYATIPAEDMVGSKVTLGVQTAEALTFTVDDDGGNWYASVEDSNANAIAIGGSNAPIATDKTCTSNAAYSFKVTPVAGRAVDSVKYTVQGGNATALTVAEDGVTYTVPADVINKPTTIAITTKAASTTAKDVVIADSANITVKDLSGTHTIDDDANAVDDGRGVATLDEYFYFRVIPDTNYKISKMEYKDAGTSTPDTKLEATEISRTAAGVVIYKTSTKVKGNISLFATVVNGVTVTKSANKLVTFNGYDVTAGGVRTETLNPTKGDQYAFTITPVTSSQGEVRITKVSYLLDTNDDGYWADETPVESYNSKIGKTGSHSGTLVASHDVRFLVETKVVVTPSSYTATFGENFPDTLGDYDYPNLVESNGAFTLELSNGERKTVGAKVDDPSIGCANKNLYVIFKNNATGREIVEVNAIDTTDISTISAGDAAWVASKTTNTNKVADLSASGETITGNRLATITDQTDTITVTYWVADSSNASAGDTNVFEYSASLGVKVYDRFSQIKLLSSNVSAANGKDSFGEGYLVKKSGAYETLTVMGVDGRTGVEKNVNNNTNGDFYDATADSTKKYIAWTVSPDYSTKSYKAYTYASSGGTTTYDKDQTVITYNPTTEIEYPENAAVTVAVTDKWGKAYDSASATVKLIEDPVDYVVVPTVTRANSEAVRGYNDMFTDETSYVALEADGSVNTATVNFNVYQQAVSNSARIYSALGHNSPATDVSKSLTIGDYAEIPASNVEVSWTLVDLVLDHVGSNSHNQTEGLVFIDPSGLIVETDDSNQEENGLGYYVLVPSSEKNPNKFITVTGSGLNWTISAIPGAAHDTVVPATIARPEFKVGGMAIAPFSSTLKIDDCSVVAFVGGRIEKDTVRLFLNDNASKTTGAGAHVVEQSLNSAWLTSAGVTSKMTTLYAATNAVASETKPAYSIGLELPEITDGTFFTLPTMADFDTANLPAGRALYGWYSHYNDGSDHYTYYDCGEKVAVTARAKDFYAIWGPKYVVTELYNNNLTNKDSEGKDVVSGALDATGTWSLLYDGVTDAKIPVGLGVKEVKGIVSTKDALTAGTAGYADLGEISYTAANVVLTETDSSGVALTSGQALDATSLASGIAKFSTTKATTYVTAAYEKDGVKYTWNGAYSGTVPAIALFTDNDSIANLTNYMNVGTAGIPDNLVLRLNQTTAATNYELTLSEVATMKANTTGAGISATLKSDASGTMATVSNFGNIANVPGTYTWTSSNESVATIKQTSGTTALNTAHIYPKSAGTTTITLTYVDPNGVPQTASTTLTVAPQTTFIKFADKDGKVIDAPEFLETYASSSNASERTAVFYLLAAGSNTAADYNAALTGGSFGYEMESGATTYVTSLTFEDVTGKPGLVKATIQGAQAYGKDTIVLKYTDTDSSVVALDAPFKTYRKVIFHANGMTNDSTTDFFVVGGKKIYKEGSTTNSDLTDQFIKVYTTDASKELVSGSTTNYLWSYTVDVSKYAAEKSTKDFPGWYLGGALGTNDAAKDATKTKVTPITTDPDDATVKTSIVFYDTNTAGSTTDNTVFSTADVVLYPHFVNAAITNVSGIPSETVKISDSVTTGASATTFKYIELGITPYNTASTLRAIAEDEGLLVLYNPYDADMNAGTTYTYGTSTAVDDLDVTKINAISEMRTDILGVGMVKGKAGKTVVHIKSADAKTEYGSFTVAISGAKWAGSKIVGYYDENGELLKNTSKTISGKTYYFDEEGATITDGICKLADGWVLVAGGVKEANAGLHDLSGKTYCIKADGTIARNGIETVSGKDYLFREDGTLVKYADADVESGKYKLGGTTYVISETDNTAKLDDILYNASVVWVDKFPAKWSKSEAIPTVTYKISYTSANTGKTATTEEALKATVTPTTVAANAETVTFTATPDLTGYFAADKTTPATAEPKTQKYMFKDGGLEGVAGSYTVKSSAFKWSDLGEGGTAPTVTLDITYTVKQEGEADREEVLTAVAVTPVKETEDDTTVTYTATYATMDEAQPTLTETKKYSKATGKAGEYTYKSHTAFTWSTLGKDDTTPTASTKVTYSVTQDGKKVADESFTATATVTLVSSSDTRKTFKAEVTTIDGKKISEEKTYNIKKTDESGNASAMEGIVIEGLWDEYEYAGKPVQPAFTLVDYDVEDGVTLAFGTDYTVKYADNKAAGTGKITITGKGNYVGKNLTASFKIVDKFASLVDKTNIAGNVKSIDKISDEFFYDGTAKYPATLTINTKDDGTLTYKYNDATGEYENQGTDAKDVVISVSNNIKAGTAVVSAQGASDKKPKTKTFKIKALDLSTAGENLVVTINGGENAAYAVKGAMPSVEAVYTNAAGDDIALIPGQDFKVTYKNNKAAGTATATLKGMKNCSKSVDKTFTIDPLDLSELDEEAVSVFAPSGKKVKNIKVTITDAYGDVIPAKALKVSVYESGKESALGDKDSIPTEFDIKIEAGKADLKESISIEGLKPVNEFKAKIAVDKAFNKAGIAYTGTPIILTDIVDDNGDNLFENGKITVTVGGTKLTYGEDFEVAGYKNNNKKGKMSFTLRGINNYAGTKVGTVKIVAKTISKIETE